MTRIDKVREHLNQLNIESLFVTTPKNVRYLSNFTGSAGWVFLTQDRQYFITDFRYKDQAQKQAEGFDIIIHSQGIFKEISRLVSELGIENVAIEADNLNITQYTQLSDIVDAELINTQGLIEEIREVKDESEIAIISEAVKIADAAFEHILTFIRPGITEIQVANELDFFMRSLGASGVSFDTIVASGIRSAMPHGVASDKVIEQGDLVTLDFGCYYQGYVSDMTRTVAVGSIDPKLEEIYHIVLGAHNLVNEQLRAGMTGKEADAIARDYIASHGYGEEFGHTLGHGIGLDVHEGPGLSMRNEKKLVVNNVVTNEPGIYVSGLGGVRIEDDLIIQEEGVIILNNTSKELIIL